MFTTVNRLCLNPFLFQVSSFVHFSVLMRNLMRMVLIPFCFRSLLSQSLSEPYYLVRHVSLNPFLFQVSSFERLCSVQSEGCLVRLNPFLFQVSSFQKEKSNVVPTQHRVLIPFCFMSLLSKE